MSFQKWGPVAELVANVATAATLLFLVYQVRENTAAVQRQMLFERASVFAEPFLSGSSIPAIMAKVKAIDGPDPLEQPFIDRYKLSYEEASIWTRYLSVLWASLEADYQARGETADLENLIRLLLARPDSALLWEHGAVSVTNAPFRAYVQRLRTP